MALAAFSWGAPIITVIPSLAPNKFGSPNWNTYVQNALSAIENGQTTNGDPSSPSYYEAVTGPLSPWDMIVTGFPSWHGHADPGSVYGAAYANELGNRPQFGLYIVGNGTQFSISQLSFIGTSNDPGHILSFGYATGIYSYSAEYVGIIDGPGGPTYITSGPNTQLVDRLVGRGSGNAAAPEPPDCPGCTIAQQQAKIDALLPGFNGMTQFSG